jgi:hypothetical protein
VTVESAKPVAVLTDPGSRLITSAAKPSLGPRRRPNGPVSAGSDRAVAGQSDGPTTQGFATVEELTNPLGTAPVVNLRDSDRILFGSSEINDLKPLGDAVNKSLADMMVTSEYVGCPAVGPPASH